jgi:hypothetical protein
MTFFYAIHPPFKIEVKEKKHKLLVYQSYRGLENILTSKEIEN